MVMGFKNCHGSLFGVTFPVIGVVTAYTLLHVGSVECNLLVKQFIKLRSRIKDADNHLIIGETLVRDNLCRHECR